MASAETEVAGGAATVTLDVGSIELQTLNSNGDASSHNDETSLKVVEKPGQVQEAGEPAEQVQTPTEATPAGDQLANGGGDDSTEMGNRNAVDIKEANRGEGDADTPTQLVSPTKRDLDDLVPAEDLWTTKANQPVKLRMMPTGARAKKPITVPSLFHSVVQRVPNHPGLCVKRGGVWVKWTYQQYFNDVRRAAKGFIKLGLEPFHGVGIIGFNAPEWFISAFGAIFAAGLNVGVYTTNSPEACRYVLSNCEANVVVVENHQQLQKVLEVWDKLPSLKAVIQYIGEPAVKHDNVYSWDQFMNLSKDVSDSSLQDRLSLLAPNRCCSLIYTSGTTGNPKGVMLSHDNLVWIQDMTSRQLSIRFAQEHFVTYLPLSHIAAQTLDMYIPLAAATTVYFAQPDALKGTLVDTWREVRPTGVFGVPRVWEKIMETMKERAKGVSGIRKKIATWAKGVGLKGSYAMQNGEPMPFGWSVANFLLFKKVRVALGLDRARLLASGAAPIHKETLEYFASLNIPLLEVFGMSECTGPHFYATPNSWRLTSVGKDFPGGETKLDNPDEEGNAEVCMNGRHVFMGYLNEEEKTREAIDADGWLHSGDLGKKDKDGFYYITGRIKELLITAGGENVAPVPVEDAVKEALPVVSNCMLIGDKKKFLSLLVTLKTESNLETLEPLDKLTPDVIDWCQSLGSPCTTVSQVISKQDPKILKAIQTGIDKANAKAVSRAQKIQKWSLLPRDFSVPGGELGPTLKLRRPIVLKLYEKTINAFYEE